MQTLVPCVGELGHSNYSFWWVLLFNNVKTVRASCSCLCCSLIFLESLPLRAKIAQTILVQFTERYCIQRQKPPGTCLEKPPSKEWSCCFFVVGDVFYGGVL